MTAGVMKRNVRTGLLMAFGLVANLSGLESAFSATDYAVTPVVQGRSQGTRSSWTEAASGSDLAQAPVSNDVTASDEPDADLDRYVELHERALGTSVRSLLMPWSSLKPIAN